MDVIYCVINKITNKIYVGKRKNDNQNYYGSGTYILNSLKKYGKENFIKIILDTYIGEEWREKERYWIKRLDSMVPNGYNIVDGGGGASWLKHTDEAKIKIGIAAGKRRKGIKLKNETKLKIGKFFKGKTYEQIMGKEKAKEQLEKRRKPITEKYSEETIISYKEKMCRPYDEKFGIERSNEIKEKQSKARIGLPQSDEKRLKCRNSKIGILNPQFKDIPDNIKTDIKKLYFEKNTIIKTSKIVGFSAYKVSRFLIEEGLKKK